MLHVVYSFAHTKRALHGLAAYALIGDLTGVNPNPNTDLNPYPNTYPCIQDTLSSRALGLAAARAKVSCIQKIPYRRACLA